jgi:diacylglycerol kinase family enzyme
VQTLLFNIMNGRYAGGGMPFTPACLFNDSLLDIAYYNTEVTGFSFLTILNQMKSSGGCHAYEPTWTSLRGSRVEMINANRNPETNELLE